MVFITYFSGCDSGFGNVLAKRMDRLGYKVFAACLDPEGAGAEDLLNNCSSNLRVLPMDVTDEHSIQKAKQLIEKELNDYGTSFSLILYFKYEF